MAFSPAFLDELRARVPPSQVIGRQVRLRKQGREYLALCPFHNEKTPSFTVNDDKGFFHCFGCGAHGSAIDFVMLTEGVPFPEAVEKLAAEAGMEVPRQTPADREAEQRRGGLLDVMEAACAWFEAQLGATAGRSALAYLGKRGLAAETMATFRLGYAPPGRHGLMQALVARGFDESLLGEAGLLIAPEDGGQPYDRFRDRVIFPITDRRDRVIAFGGRALGEAKAKYVNSPETPLFHKGHVLYNLARARIAAREAGTVLVAEGYMDVIALAAAGLKHAVAPLGTAVTEAQIQELWRLAPEPVLCLDGDEAGRRAARRAGERCLPLLKPGYSLRFAILPKGEDPDSLIARRGVGAIAALVDEARPLVDVLWDSEILGRNFDTPERQAALRKRLSELTGEIVEPTVRRHYRDHFASLLDAAFRRRRGREDRRPMVGRPGLSGGHRLINGIDELERRREEVLLLIPINYPELFTELVKPLEEITFKTPDLDRLREAIIDVANHAVSLDREGLKSQLSERGFSEIIDRMGGPDVNVHVKFAQGDVAAAKLEWRDALERHHRAVTIPDRLEALGADLADDMTEETQAPLLALQRGAQEDGEGVDSGEKGTASVRDANS